MKKTNCLKYPLIPLRGITVFPNMVLSFAIGREKSKDALEKAMANDEILFLVTQKDSKTTDPTLEELYRIGTLSKVKQVLRLPGDITHVIVEGIQRAELLDFYEEEAGLFAKINTINQEDEGPISDSVVALVRSATDQFEEYKKLNPKTSQDPLVGSISSSNPGQVADMICATLTLSPEKKQELLEITDSIDRLNKVLDLLVHEIFILAIKKEIDAKVKKRIDISQKEYYLREELKVIQEELGDKDGIQADVAQFQQSLEKKNLPSDAEKIMKKEIGRLSKISASSPEYHVLRTYIETVLSLPWKERTKEKFDLKKCEKILNQEHYGLETIKERILEFLAVRKNTDALHSPIICLVGPPGVGKTSIAKSIAKALNRNYVRMSLGGVKDEAEIRGHRKTYVGAMPGRIIHAMKQAHSINPLMLLDEVDKLSSSYNGDPSSALLEVLDSEQNNTFRDHYLELPYNLSETLFICTANSLDSIPPALKDRMEILSLSGYSSEEKKMIAQKFLLPKQMEQNGISKSSLKINKSAIEALIENYTREAGVRQLERVLGKICRKVVKKRMAGEEVLSNITSDDLEDFLGMKKYRFDEILQQPQVGVVRGLAWTQVGGDTLQIEANVMKGSGKLDLTGNMGNVMKESAKAALSYIRSQSEMFAIPEDFYKDMDIHIHIPEGAVPKDGPSAGITMATAILSALSGVRVKNDVAMTGEITIRGRVLPIGGLKEKVLAAKRAGIKTILLPSLNEKDLKELSEETKSGLEFFLVQQMDDVLKHAIVKGEKIWK